MFVYQKKIMIPLSQTCPEEEFFGQVRDVQTQWLVKNCRMALDYANSEQTSWPRSFSEEFSRYLMEQAAKPRAGKAFAQKTQKEKLEAYAKHLKSKLPAAIFQASSFDLSLSDKAKEKIAKETTEEEKEAMMRPWVKQEQVRLNGLAVMDIDHVERFEFGGLSFELSDYIAHAQTRREIQEKISNLKPQFSNLGILLVYVSPSGRGLKIVFKARSEWGNLIDNQLKMADLLGVKIDESCKDASRRSFLTTEEDILFIDKEIFTYENKGYGEQFDALYRNGRSQATREVHAAEGGNPCDPCRPCQEITWRGLKIQSMIDARYADKLPCRDDSNRHNESLKLATDLMLMLDGDKRLVKEIVERQPWVQEIIDERDEDVAQTVESAAKQLAKREETTSKPYPSKAMQAAIEKVSGMSYRELIADGGGAGKCAGNSMDGKLQEWGEEIAAMFDDFPLLRDVCAGLKVSQYPAALFVAGGTGMTLMTRTWYRFYHRPQQERRLNCSLFIIGHPASNKSMADDIYDILSAPIKAADQAGKAALNRYKQDQNKKAANKEGKDKPQGMIRVHPARTSNGQLIQDMLNAKETIEGKEIQLHLFTFDTELDNSITLQSGGSWINKQSMELKAFHNEMDGQMYQNSDSPVDEFRVTWNYIYTGTPIALKKKVTDRNFGSGLSTRLAVIPMPKTKYQMIGFEEQTTIDWQRLERMKTWAYRLDTRFGELPFWDIVKRLYDWTKDRMEDCEDDDSEANELMLKRVPYHAINYAAPFIDMRHWNSLHQQGCYWTGEYQTDDTDWKLCELIARIQYATQQHFFGVMAEKYFDDMNNDVQISGKRHYQKSVDGYNRLPEVFTLEDLKRCFGFDSDNSAYSKIRRLIKNAVIEKCEEKGKYQKLKKLMSA